MSITQRAKDMWVEDLVKENKRLKNDLMQDMKEITKLEEENKKLKEKVKRLEFDVDAWHQLKLLLEWEIEKLKEERDKYYAEWHLRHS